MLEGLLELLLGALGELLLNVAVELLCELGLESIGHAFRSKRTANPILSGIGLLLAGALLGLIVGVAIPHRLIPATRFHGASLVLSPLAAGAVLQMFGTAREAGGHRTTFLATWWGGALFAFGFSGVRYLLVG